MKAIAFLLHTKQPLLATSLQGDPHSSVSHGYIPGSMLRGALIGRYLQRHKFQNTDILANENIRRLFFDDTTRYLNAYLFNSQEEKRTLPTPRSFDLEYEKNKEFAAFSSQSPIADFCTIDGRDVVFYKEKRRINIHNQRDRQKGRATKDDIVFRYDALDSGQTFQAIVLCDRDEDVEIITALLKPENFWLGGSQSAGYGHTEISQVQVCDNWHEVKTFPEERGGGDRLYITLLSDLILCDEWGQYVAVPPNQNNVRSPLTQLLQEELQVEKLQHQRSYASSKTIGGFNRKWGLPLPQVPALAAGSVFLFDRVELQPEQIRNLEAQGIGERRVEGFGRVAVNWFDENQIFQTKRSPVNREFKRSPSLQSRESRTLATQMANRLLRQRLDRSLLERVGNTKLEGNISSRQLSRLMAVAQKALSGDRNCDLVRELLNNLPLNVRRQFQHTKVDNQPLDRQLNDWLNNPHWITNIQPLTIADQTQSVSDELVREYTLRLIMEIAKKALLENKR